MRTSARCRRTTTLIVLPICAVGARASRRRQSYCQSDHENLCHFNLSNKTTSSCHLFNTAPDDSARPFFQRRAKVLCSSSLRAGGPLGYPFEGRAPASPSFVRCSRTFLVQSCMSTEDAMQCPAKTKPRGRFESTARSFKG